MKNTEYTAKLLEQCKSELMVIYLSDFWDIKIVGVIDSVDKEKGRFLMNGIYYRIKDVMTMLKTEEIQ